MKALAVRLSTSVRQWLLALPGLLTRAVVHRVQDEFLSRLCVRAEQVPLHLSFKHRVMLQQANKQTHNAKVRDQH